MPGKGKFRKLKVFKNRYDVSLPTFIGREVKQGARNLKYALRWRGVDIHHLDFSRPREEPVFNKEKGEFTDPKMEGFFKVLEETFDPDYMTPGENPRETYAQWIKDYNYHVTVATKDGKVIGGSISSLGELEDGSKVLYPEFAALKKEFRGRGLGSHIFNKHYREVRKSVGGRFRNRVANFVKKRKPAIKYVIADVHDRDLTTYQKKRGSKLAIRFRLAEEGKPPEELEETNLTIRQSWLNKHKEAIPSEEVNKILRFLGEWHDVEGEELEGYMKSQGLPEGIKVELRTIKSKKKN